VKVNELLNKDKCTFPKITNSETDEENYNNYEPSSNEDEEDAIADDDSQQTSEWEKDSGPSVRRPNTSSRPTTVPMLTSKNGKEHPRKSAGY
jgi:hypothetical protein